MYYVYQEKIFPYLVFNPVFHHFSYSSHDFGVSSPLNQPSKNVANKRLPHFLTHDAHSVLD